MMIFNDDLCIIIYSNDSNFKYWPSLINIMDGYNMLQYLQLGNLGYNDHDSKIGTIGIVVVVIDHE